MSATKERPNTLVDAPLQYAPQNEIGVVYLFAHVAKRLQFRIEEIRAAFPDCIAYRRTGNSERLVHIEFEFRSSNFRAHKHDAEKCDCIVCWFHDWPDCPKTLEIIELRQFFGAVPKVWIQPAIKSQWHWLDECDEMDGWALSKRATIGDILLMYRCHPAKKITEIFIVTGELERGEASWRAGDCYYGPIQKLGKLDSPIFLEDLRNHHILSTSSFIRSNMQGNLLVSEYWPYLYTMILNRNPKLKRVLAPYAPEKL